jgi:DNA polymerase elongation subunit (family B)
MSEPKILLLDIETSPAKVWTFGIHNVNIGPKQIIEPTDVMCWAAKWLGSNEILFMDWSDPKYIETIHQMIDEADGVVHYNGKSFDMKHLNREFLLRGMDPPSPYVHIDLLSCMRTNFRFISNKLEWTSLELGYEGKVSTRGFRLWTECMEGCEEAWEEMKEYNIQDVALLEDMHDDLLPWIKGYPNRGVYSNASEPTCTNCGSTDVHKRGTQKTAVRTYHRYHCNSCGKWSRSRGQSQSTNDGVLR